MKSYKRIYQPAHPYSTKKGFVMEHRLVMEDHLDRLLKPEELVHHINGDKSDNRLKNLKLFKSKGVHSSFHSFSDGNKKKDDGRNMGKIIIEVEDRLKKTFKSKIARQGLTIKKVLTDFIEKYIKPRKR